MDLQGEKKLGDFDFGEIAVGVFYGTSAALTDKYEILRGINRGAKHDVADLRSRVSVYAGRDFWAWINHGEKATQEWVLEGIQQGFVQAEKSTGSLAKLLKEFREKFSEQFQIFIDAKGAVDWYAIIKNING